MQDQNRAKPLPPPKGLMAETDDISGGQLIFAVVVILGFIVGLIAFCVWVNKVTS